MSRETKPDDHLGGTRPSPTEINDKIEAFHAHLDCCPQCEQHPFELCPEGETLLKAL